MEPQCSSSSTGGGAATTAVAETRRQRAPREGHNEKQYRGVRMRKWGKWVAETREPNKRTRIWLGSYSTPIAAARAYDTAVYYLRGASARLNFPELVFQEGKLHDLSAAAIRKKAIEVGNKVDALETERLQHHVSGVGRVGEAPDLNQIPEPEDTDDD